MKTVTLEKKIGDIGKKAVGLSKKAGIGKKLPRLETVFEDEGDPLEAVDFDAETLEERAEGEMSEIVRQIIADKKARYERFRVASDPDYFVALCFQSSDQKDEFLRNSGWGPAGEKYLNGLEIARLLGIQVTVVEISPMKPRGKPGKYSREEVI